ncbi:protein phosphatase 1 regulatory subunit 12B [Ixodes scapularis]|uniref:protein phosphatase 1 regulatory subunit 12B n=1 Tax=Ixodes scapularis TaxID=6945 RepID=UPI001A9CD48F|nr:protein phosphatase 1 regulatory subunit 12B [Ixodes scapularis]
MSLESRPSNSLFKRKEQLKRWEDSETNQESADLPPDKPQKIKFSDGCIFLAACAAGDTAEVSRLLERGADINTTNVDGLTALHQACIDDNMAMVEFLVEHGCDPNLGDNEGWTPLHATASCGFVSVARYLIENGANVALVNNDGDLPIDIAESGEMEELLQAEIDRLGVDCEAARNEEERLMLEDAKQMLNSSRLLDKVHPKTGATSLHVAAAKGYLKVMTLLIQAGVDLNAQDWDGWTPLHAASHWGQKGACRLLCDSLANMALPNHVGQTCFDLADPEVLPTLEELKKKQASMQKERPEIQEILERKAQRPPLKRRTSVTRMSLADKNSAVVKDTSSERNAIEAHLMLSKVDEEAERKSEEREIGLLPNSLEERQVARKNEVNRAVSNAFLENAADATTPAADKTRQSVEKEGEEVTLALRRLRRPSPAPNVEPCPVETVVTVAHPQRESVITPASPPPVAVATITIDDKKKEPSPPSEIVTLRKRLRVNAEPENADDTTTPSENSSQGPLKRTFVMPVRDEESETQRKAHAKRVRETRRSTQGVMLEDLKSAEQQLQKKQQERDEGRQEKPPSSAAAAVATTTATTTTSAPSSAATTTALSEELGRRLSWRNRDKQEEEVPAVRVVPSSPDGTPVVTLSMPARARVQRATVTGSGDVSHTVTVPIRPRSALDDLSLRDGSDADKDDSRTNSAVQRRRRPKRRSTGVVYLEGEGSQEPSPEKESADQDKLRIGAHDLSNDVKSMPDPVRARSGSAGSLADSTKSETESRLSSSAASLQDDDELDYKKLYLELKEVHERLKGKVSRLEDELDSTKRQLEKSQLNNRNSLSDAEKRERRALERKISELEEELKGDQGRTETSRLREENARLREENGALIRVISKLSK